MGYIIVVAEPCEKQRIIDPMLNCLREDNSWTGETTNKSKDIRSECILNKLEKDLNGALLTAHV